MHGNRHARVERTSRALVQYPQEQDVVLGGGRRSGGRRDRADQREHKNQLGGASGCLHLVVALNFTLVSGAATSPEMS